MVWIKERSEGEGRTIKSYKTHYKIYQYGNSINLPSTESPQTHKINKYLMLEAMTLMKTTQLSAASS